MWGKKAPPTDTSSYLSFDINMKANKSYLSKLGRELAVFERQNALLALSPLALDWNMKWRIKRIIFIVCIVFSSCLAHWTSLLKKTFLHNIACNLRRIGLPIGYRLGDTVIKKAVLPGRGSPILLRWVCDPCDYSLWLKILLRYFW